MSKAPSSSRSWHPLPDWFRNLAARERGSVLLETAKFDSENFRTLLFRNPVHELVANSPEDVSAVFEQVDRYVDEGRYVAGFVSYECGELFQQLSAFSGRAPSSMPLVRMGVFGAPLVFDHRSGTVHGDAPGPVAEVGNDDAKPARIEEAALQITEQEYAKKIHRVQDYLAAGHSYQVNLTDRVTGTFTGSPLALYQGLLQAQPVSYAAFMDCGAYQVLSLSPELFYRTENGRITVRPMKGTWPCGVTLEDGEQAARDLLSDEKNRAEHVMIVDLLRNDIGRICRMGTIQVDRLMHVERYRTLLQLTSTITGTLDAGKSPTQRFASLFPSGSITGAPKRQTMKIIRELEDTKRDVYTGAIGWFGPGGKSCFNVAIRTVVANAQRFTFGVGGGITAYSNATEEYEECRLKASFLQHSGRAFQLIETMRAEGTRIALLDAHLRRLQKSAAYFQIPFDEPLVRNEVAACLEANTHSPARVRLTLDEWGGLAVSATPLDSVPWAGRILLSPSRTEASDVFLHHKTTNRALYESALRDARKAGFDEVLFTNQNGFVTEGAISSVFLRIDDAIVTPDEASGLLPGVFRQAILDQQPQTRIRPIRLEEFLTANQIWFGNALRGCRAVRTIENQKGEIVWTESIDEVGNRQIEFELDVLKR